jgi:hypothetical protein
MEIGQLAVSVPGRPCASKSIQPILRYETNKIEILGYLIIERFIEIFERFIFEWSLHFPMSAVYFLHLPPLHTTP